MNNQYPRLDPNGVYHNPTPAPLQPLAFDPNTGWSGSPNYSAHNTGVAQPTNPMTVGQARVLDGMGQTNTPTMQTYGLNAPSLSSAFQSPSTDYTYDAHQAMYGGLNKTDLNMSMNDTFNNSLGITDSKITGDKPDPSLLDNTKTAWGKMSYGERGTAMLGAATGLYGAYNAHKTGKLAREQLNFTKDSFNRNFEAQAKTTNAQLADRQNARHARDPKAHASVSDYMKKYGV